jgi:5'-nucleotidase/UDP-sugar diphosphatase
VGERKIVRSQETNLGNLIARTQRLKVDADVAIMNSGGIRTSIAKGDITYKDVLKVQPFSNSICLVTLTGKELKKYCEIAANKKPGSGAYAQFDNANVVMKGESLESISVGGAPVDDTKKYRLAINSFIAAGGDGYMKVTGLPTFVDSGFIDADILKEYIQKNSPLNPDDFAPTGDVIWK